MTRSLAVLAVSVCLATSWAPAHAQTSPFVSDEHLAALVEEISGDRAYDDIRRLTPFHRTAGSPDFFAATELIRQWAEEAGLEDVQLIRQEWDGTSWNCRRGEAWIVGSERRKLASYDEVPLTIADGSRTTRVEAELIDVGAGTSDEDYEGLEVEGRIVLASAAPGRVLVEAVWKRGALGVVSWATARDSYVDAPDQIAWGRIPFEADGVDGVDDGTPGTFAVMISPRQGLELVRELAGKEEPLRVSVDIEAEIDEEAEQAMVEGWIRGSEIADQQIVLVSHIQEEVGSANDDGSGIASMLEIARALTRLVEEGRIPRPRRDIRFWWVNELSSQPRYFRENPDEPRKMLLAINQDMVGARQSWGGRVQYASYTPWSRPHVLDDVVESVLRLVRDGNTGLLTFRGTARPPRFQRPILSIKGSREPFHARMIPFYGFSDHESFLVGPVGVPATAFINWPDDWIHSSGDDLDNIDATQLQRNAVVVAAVASYFAVVGAEEVGQLGALVSARARSRLDDRLATAIERLGAGTAETWNEDHYWARNLLLRSTEREVRAVETVAELDPTSAAREQVTRWTDGLESHHHALRAELDSAFEDLTGTDPRSVVRELDDDERELAGSVFAPVTDLGAYFDGMSEVGSGGLHRALAFELLSFCDGSRTGLEVYESVVAEAMAAGDWYYGALAAGEALELLRAAVEAGALEERPVS